MKWYHVVYKLDKCITWNKWYLKLIIQLKVIRKWKRISFKYHRTGQALLPMNPKPVKFLNSPCWRALHHVHIYKFKLNFTLFKGFTRRKSNRHIQKNRQNDHSFSKQWFIHKRFQEDQLRSSQNYNRCRAIPILSQHSFSNTHKQN